LHGLISLAFINITVNPVVFLGLRWYGVMIALGILVLVSWVVWQIKRDKNNLVAEPKLSVDTVFTAAIVGIPSGIIVSRLLHVIDLWPYYSTHPEQIVGGDGLSIWGAILGGTLGLFLYSRFSKFDFGYFMDLVVPGLIMAQMLGRTGCTINGCCYGLPSDMPWAIVYANPASEAGIDLGIPVQPTQVYEIIFLAITLAVMLPLRKFFKPSGAFFVTYLSVYSVWRIVIDFIRPGNPLLFGLHEAQIISIIVLAICIPLLVRMTMKYRRTVRVSSNSATN
jgi:phosphatidylglycerol---prolipoprotein diacylglyceryl transferase